MEVMGFSYSKLLCKNFTDLLNFQYLYIYYLQIQIKVIPQMYPFHYDHSFCFFF